MDEIAIALTDRFKIKRCFMDALTPFYETTKSIYTGHYRIYFDKQERIDKIVNYETGRIHTASASYPWR